MEEIASELKDKRRDVSLPSHLKATSEETLANEGVDKRQITMAATERFISLANLFKLGTSDDGIIPALIFLHNILEVGSGLSVLLCAVLTRLSTVQPQYPLAIPLPKNPWNTLRFIRYANGVVVFEGSTGVVGLTTNSDILRQQLLGFQ